MEPGESDHQAVVREVAEETGLRVRAGRLLGRVRRAAPNGAIFDIADYVCQLAGTAEPTAGSDADDARWVNAGDYAELSVVAGLTAVLTEWDVLPATEPATHEW